MAPREDAVFLLPAAPDLDSYEFLLYGVRFASAAIVKKAGKLGVSEVAQPRDATIGLLRWMEEQLLVTAEWLTRGQVSFSPGVMLVYREAIVGLRDGLELAGDPVPTPARSNSGCARSIRARRPPCRGPPAWSRRCIRHSRRWRWRRPSRRGRTRSQWS